MRTSHSNSGSQLAIGRRGGALVAAAALRRITRGWLTFWLDTCSAHVLRVRGFIFARALLSYLQFFSCFRVVDGLCFVRNCVVCRTFKLSTRAAFCRFRLFNRGLIFVTFGGREASHMTKPTGISSVHRRLSWLLPAVDVTTLVDCAFCDCGGYSCASPRFYVKLVLFL